MWRLVSLLNAVMRFPLYMKPITIGNNSKLYKRLWTTETRNTNSMLASMAFKGGGPGVLLGAPLNA